MERESSGKGFLIDTGKIPITLSLKRISDLRPHEEIVDADLHSIVKALEKDPVLRHPIIADIATGAVLDGTHRLAALSRLGCVTVPSALIDYQNPLVRVDRWFRRIDGENLYDFSRRVGSLSPETSPSTKAEEGLESRTLYAALRDQKLCFAFKSTQNHPLELCRKAFSLETIARDNRMKISYLDTDKLEDFPNTGFLMSTIRLTKSEVITSCMTNTPFPPKSTRHLIPSRPLGVSFPLRWLREPNITLAETEFVMSLRSRKMKRLPEGTWVGSRRYMEEVFLFE